MSVRPNRLQIHNSLTRRKMPFEPLVEGHVGMYVCGPTVYSHAHLGHAKAYVSFDAIVRYLRHLGYKVRYVQNITDVGHLTDDADQGEDKLVKRARIDQVHPMELAETYARSYFADMAALKVTPADICPRATGHILEQIAIIRDLIASGHAYEVDGSVYFAVTSWPDYGVLSGRQVDEAEEGYRIEVRREKRDPRDFALWKKAEKGHILRWESPWGWGFPGWHIECSAMSTKYLGPEFDIHGGGLDNIFPHHECEVAQSRAAGLPFARFWMHNNLLNVDGQKMGKSLGNFITIKDALARHDPETIRFFILSTHYRSPSNYTQDALAAAAAGLARLRGCARSVAEALASAGESPAAGDAELARAVERADLAFHAAMDDDFNAPGAIAALFDLVRDANTALAGGAVSAGPLRAVQRTFEGLGEGVLGILGGSEPSSAVDLGGYVALLLEVRAELKARKAFDLADRIRDRLTALGVEVKDTKDGAKWALRSAPVG